jgi:hypothetical protein
MVLSLGARRRGSGPFDVSKNRHSRFRQSDLLRKLFETVVARCIKEGIAGGDAFAVDWRDSGWECRKPIATGQLLTVISNGETTTRFHRERHDSWLAEQEELARQPLGFVWPANTGVGASQSRPIPSRRCAACRAPMPSARRSGVSRSTWATTPGDPTRCAHCGRIETPGMENEVQSLTKGRQHLGMHVNFSGDLFVACHH